MARTKDGWVEMQNGQLIVHDPDGAGRFATLTAGEGIRLWVNGREAEGPAVVTAGDQLRYELDIDPRAFFTVSISADVMSAELLLWADPMRVPDIVTLEGQTQLQLRSGYSARAPRRPLAPKDLVMKRLQEIGVVYGVDEAAIDRELAAPTYRPAVVARGQAPREAIAGEWSWLAGKWGLAEPGQVVAMLRGGEPGRLRTTVTGKTDPPLPEVADPTAFVPGEGCRLVSGGRLVAMTKGRARSTPTDAGRRIDVVPVRVIDGDWQGELSEPVDILIQGNLRDAKVRTGGQVVVEGHVERSEVYAGEIQVEGTATQSKLHAMPGAPFAVLRAELAFIRRRLADMRSSLEQQRPVRDQAIKELVVFIRAMRLRAEELDASPDAFKKPTFELANALSRLEGATEIPPTVMERIDQMVAPVQRAADATAESGRVEVGSLVHSSVWAGREIRVQDKCVSSSLFCGGTVETSAQTSVSQAEIVAGGSVRLGVASTMRATAPVLIRAGRVEAEELQAGCTLEFGSHVKEINTDLFKVLAGVNPRGQLFVTQQS